MRGDGTLHRDFLLTLTTISTFNGVCQCLAGGRTNSKYVVLLELKRPQNRGKFVQYLSALAPIATDGLPMAVREGLARIATSGQVSQ
jgi:hypothetical protein